MEINKRKSILPWLLAAAVLVFLVAAYLLFHSMDRYTFQEAAWYPLMGTNLEISSGVKATLEEGEDRAVLQLKDTKVTCEDAPAFFTKKKGLVTLSSWAVITLEADQSLGVWRLAPFTEVQASGNTVIISRNGKNEIANAAALFNGEDTYVVLKDAVLHLPDGDVELPAFSYVIASYDNWVQYQNYVTGEYAIVYPGTTEIMLSVPSAQLELCVDCDLMTYQGKERMLVSSLDLLDDFLGRDK